MNKHLGFRICLKKQNCIPENREIAHFSSEHNAHFSSEHNSVQKTSGAFNNGLGNAAMLLTLVFHQKFPAIPSSHAYPAVIAAVTVANQWEESLPFCLLPLFSSVPGASSPGKYNIMVLNIITSRMLGTTSSKIVGAVF